MANPKQFLIQNASATQILFNQQYGNYELAFQFANILLPGTPVQQTLPLWTKQPNDDKIDPETVKQTETALREALNNPKLNFNVPSNPQDPDDATVWLNANQPVDIKGIYQNGTRYQLGEAGNSAFGNSVFRHRFDPQAGGTYDPDTNYVGIYDALPVATQQAIANRDTSNPNMNTYKSGATYLSVNGIVSDLAWSSANTFGATVTRENLDALITKIAKFKALSDDQMVTGILERIESLPTSGQPYGLSNVIALLGGTEAPNLRAVQTVQTSIAAMIQQVGRMALILYVKVPETGYTFKATQLRYPRSFRGRNEFYAETLQADFRPTDLNDLLTQQSGISQNKMSQILVEHDLYNHDDAGNATSVKWDTVDESLTLLKAMFVGREIEVSTKVADKNGLSDPSRMGSYLQSFGAMVGVPETTPATSQQATVTETTPTDSAAPYDAAMDPFAGTPNNSAAPTPESTVASATSQTDLWGTETEPAASAAPTTAASTAPAPKTASSQPSTPTQPTQAGPNVADISALGDNPFAI